MTGPTTRAGINRAQPLPHVLQNARFRRPTDPADGPVDHFLVIQFIGEASKISSYGLAHKMHTHLSETGQKPLIIEVPPQLLDVDITDGIERAGLREQLNDCRAIFFCSDLYDLEDGERLVSFAPRLDPPARQDIYIHSRTPGEHFQQGLGYFTALAQPLAWLKAKGQTDRTALIPFLQSLNITSAINSLLNNFPADEATRGYFLGFLRATYAQARETYAQLIRGQMTAEADNLPDEAIRLYGSLGQSPLLRPVEELVGRASDN